MGSAGLLLGRAGGSCDLHSCSDLAAGHALCSLPALPIPPIASFLIPAVQFNPNLYAEGKVCLSLLGTWQVLKRGRRGARLCSPGWQAGLYLIARVLCANCTAHVCTSSAAGTRWPCCAHPGAVPAVPLRPPNRTLCLLWLPQGGRGESWSPDFSTVLQVLISIQASW